MDAVDSTGLVIPISVWTKKLPPSKPPKCIIVMEPVERTTAKVTFDSTVSVL
jgi:PAS domain-containing serine/threonine kinase